MPTVTREGLRKRVQAAVGDDAGLQRFESDTLNMWLEDEFENILIASAWPNTLEYYSLVTVPDQQKYNLPPALVSIEFILNPDGTSHLPYIGKLDFHNPITAIGYTLFEEPVVLYLKPTPTEAVTYTILYYARPQLPSGNQADAAMLDIPVELRDALVYRVAAKCAERDRDFNLVQTWNAKADQSLGSAKRNLLGDRVRDRRRLRMARVAW